MLARACSIVMISAALAPSVARADDGPDYFAHAGANQVVVRHTPERTAHQRHVITGLLVGGAAFAGLGVWFHLDSHRAADDVSSQSPTARSWTVADDELVERAERSGRVAIAAYSISALFLGGALYELITTTPHEQARVYGPTATAPTARLTVTPLPGGALVGTGWGF